MKTESVDLIFDRGRFQIENRFTVDGGHAYWLPGSNGAMEVLEVLVGHQVFEAFSTDTEILLRFEGGNELRISLRDEDFIGPEAASYLPNDGLIIVFN